jgi:hypothetical protein
MLRGKEDRGCEQRNEERDGLRKRERRILGKEGRNKGWKKEENRTKGCEVVNMSQEVKFTRKVLKRCLQMLFVKTRIFFLNILPFFGGDILKY